jgi:hypothetical protein
MDIKTAVLAIPFSIVLRHITNKALAEVTARWPVLQKILSRTCSKENSMLKISFTVSAGRTRPTNSRIRPVYRIGSDSVFNSSVLFYAATESTNFGPPRNCTLAR